MCRDFTKLVIMNSQPTLEKSPVNVEGKVENVALDVNHI